jgi:hypothetical protein
MPASTTRHLLGLGGVCVLIAGCGGGGGSSGSGPNAPPTQLQTAPVLLETNEDTPFTAQATAVDSNGDTLTYSKSAEPTHGTLAITSTGALTYTPGADYNGIDAFGIQVSDGRGGTTSATFTVSIRAVNDAPRFVTTSVTFTEDATYDSSQLEVVDPEGDAIELETVSDASHGDLSTGNAGWVSYKPDANFSGTDSFVGKLRDDKGAMGADTPISIVVTAVNDTPTPVSDQFVYTSGSPPFDVVANDTDVDGDALFVSIVTQPNVGTASVVNNRISYTPPANYSGPASLRYSVADNGGLYAEAIVSIVVSEFPKLVVENGPSFADPGLWLYDGFTPRIIHEGSYGVRENYALSRNGRWIFFSSRTSQSNNGVLYQFDLTQPRGNGNPRTIYGLPSFLGIATNFDGSYVLNFSNANVMDNPRGSFITLIRVSDATFVNYAAPPSNVFGGSGQFNPVSDEFYVVANVSSASPPAANTSVYSTVYAGRTSTPGLTQIGSTYPVGAGSGVNLHVSANGRYLVHGAVNSSTVGSLLVNDRMTSSETDLYRAFAAGEFATPSEFDVNAAGTRVCLRVNAAGSTGDGPGRFWVADPAAPGTATAVTPVTDVNRSCRWASDGKTIVYLSGNGGGPVELWQVNSDAPNVVTRSREPLAPGETIAFFAVAEKSMTAVIGVTPAGSSIPQLYRVALDSPGTSTRFASPGVSVAEAEFGIDPAGNWLGYLKDGVHLTSTTVADVDIEVPRATGSTWGGVFKGFRFVPAP